MYQNIRRLLLGNIKSPIQLQFDNIKAQGCYYLANQHFKAQDYYRLTQLFQSPILYSKYYHIILKAQD